MTESDDEFDLMLRQSLADQPEPTSTVDFAHRVLVALAPPRRLAMWPMVVAGIAVFGVLMAGVLRLLAIQQSSNSLSDLSTSSTTSDVVALLPAGGVGLLLALVWLTARSAFTVRPDELLEAAR